MIQTQDAVRAMVGEDTRFTCQLTQHKKVIQMTWQRIPPGGGTENVGTCNKRHGTQINPPFQGKVQFVDTGLQSSTIVVRNVSKADESCYICLFNAYPGGSIQRKTCLIVYEQPEPILDIIKPNGTEPMVVSCSVVSHSRPAPSVTLEVPSHVGSSNNSTVHAASPNGTVTVTSTVTLERFCSNGTQVRCVVCFSSGFIKESSRVIDSDEQDLFCDAFDKFEADPIPPKVDALVIGVVVGVIIFIIFGLAFGLVFRSLASRKKGTRTNHSGKDEALPWAPASPQSMPASTLDIGRTNTSMAPLIPTVTMSSGTDGTSMI